MLPRRYDHIVAFRYEDGSLLAFHDYNLQVAQVDEGVWTALSQAPIAGSTTSPVAEAWEDLQIWNQEVSPTSQDAPPAKLRALSIHVAQICNMRCTYCGAGGDGTYGAKEKKIDIDDVLPMLTQMLRETPDGDSFQLNFLGGEPLLYPDLVEEIIRYSRLLTAGRNIRLLNRIVTNGTLINSRTLKLLTQYNFEVMVSIDGPPSITDRVRPMATRQGSSSLVHEGMTKLCQVRGGLRALKTNSVFGEHHMDLVATYEFLRSYSPDQMTFTYALGSGDIELARQFARGFARVAQIAFALGGERELRRIDVFDNLFERLDRQVRLHNLCGVGKSFLVMDTLRNVHVCNWFANHPEERVGYKDELFHKQMEQYTRSLIELNNCHDCWARHLCGGGCLYANKLETGDKHKSDPSFCVRQRDILATGIFYYAKARAEENETSKDE